MSELSPKAVYATMQQDAKQGPLAKPLLIARVIAIAAAIGGAIPTATNFYQSWKHGIPYNEVSHRLSQYDLWVKNFNCKIDYRSLHTGQGTRVDAGACPKSGDIALKLTTPSGQAAYEWIAFEKLQQVQSQAKAAFWSLVVSPAMAEDVLTQAKDKPTRMAQSANAPAPAAPALGSSSLQVICQTLQSKSSIVRVVNESGKCYRENFSPFLGKVEKREEVPCTTQCPPAKG